MILLLSLSRLLQEGRRRHTTTLWMFQLFVCIISLVVLPLTSSSFTTTTTTTTTAPSQQHYNRRKSKLSAIRISRILDGNTPNNIFLQTRRKTTRLSSTTTTTEDTATILPQDSSPIELSMEEYSITTTTGEEEEEVHPPVLFLHGLLGSKRNFRSLATSLSSKLKKKRRIYALDLRNHGNERESKNWRKEMSYQSMAEDVIYTMDRQLQQQKKVVVVGHSMGGKVASCMALLYPERIVGLVVLDMAPVTYTTSKDSTWKAVHDIVVGLHENIDLNSCHTKRDVDLQLRTNLHMGDPALRAFILTNIQVNNNNDNKVVQWTIPMDIVASQLTTLGGWDIHNRVYTGDTFFIAGGQSKFIRSSHLQEIRTQFPNHMLTTIRGAGHWLHAEAPDAVLALVQKYLDR